MGFMDKAKKLAEQAQTKLEDVQKDFNEKQGGSTGSPAGAGAPVEYDEHGRATSPQAPDLPDAQAGDLGAPKGDPLSAEPTAPAATPQQGDPLSSGEPSPPVDAAPGAAPAGEVRATPSQGDPLLDETESKPKPPSGGGLTSGDPLG
jgi:hypothetical protein